ncbi:hypothetical protein [Streptomyces sp. NPDC006879]|uniref:hypothetical protein n=1 Tax=Streptomyces sp. NPDC006879 TaxID=3364767 RepID=UPI00368960C5
MSKVTIVSTVTYALEVDLPLGFLIDEKVFAAQHSKDAVQALRDSAPTGQKVIDAQASTVVIPARPW